MHRRVALRTTATTLLLGIAGCLDDDPIDEESTDTNETDPGTTSPNETDMRDSDRVDSVTITRTGDCEQSGTASVEFATADLEAIVTGCVTGHNGCAEPVVRSAEMADDRFRIVIGENDISGPDTVCTQQLVTRGYELTVRFVDAFPATIEVIHDDVDGRGVVTTVDRP